VQDNLEIFVSFEVIWVSRRQLQKGRTWCFLSAPLIVLKKGHLEVIFFHENEKGTQ